MAKKKNTMEEVAKKIKPWVKTILVTILSIAGIISAIVFAYFSVTTLLKGYSLEAEDKYLFFKDILIINLTIIGVIFAAIVFWIHVFITERIKNDIEKSLKERDVFFSDYVQGIALLNDSYILWLTYESTEEKKFLNAAIEHAVLAFKHAELITEENDDYILIKCQIRNNLGYYLAVRGDKDDKEFAIECADFIKKRVKHYPEKETAWLDTYNGIMSTEWGITSQLDP